MKVVILAGGFGTRISEESHLKPKPMIEIGNKPILWHILKIYSAYGFNDFVICLGYKAHAIKEYFANYYMHQSNVSFDFRDGNKMTLHKHAVEPWKVTLVDTGVDTMTGGRVKRIAPYVDNQAFMLTYGDGVADIDVGKLLDFHKKGEKLATVTAVQPSGRFGALDIAKDHTVARFVEKPPGDNNWISGGFFVFEPEVFPLIESDNTILEREPLIHLAERSQLQAFKHHGFWHPMDTLRDKNYLDGLVEKRSAPWITWET